MATPAFRLRSYVTTFSATLNPIENGTVSALSIGPKFSYIPGNSVLVVNAQFPTNRFEAIVTSYDYNTGLMDLEQITNIRGMSFGGPKSFTMNVCGERGSTVITGLGTPPNTSGRVGDVYIDTSTGDFYTKN